MKKKFVILAALICLLAAFSAACAPENDNAGGRIYHIGEIVEFAPFGNQTVTTVTEREENALMINQREALIVGAGRFTLTAALQETVISGEFVSAAAEEQLAAADVLMRAFSTTCPRTGPRMTATRSSA